MADVSIVLVTYNRAAFLPKTLNGLVTQTFGDFELLICDDRSTDSTPEVAAAYAERDARIRYIRNDINLGMPGNLNAGIKRARSEFVAILHDGDIYYPTIIEKWRTALIQNPTAGFVFNVYRHMNPDGRSGASTCIFPDLMSGSEFLEKRCFADPEMECPVWGTVMARRSVIEEMNHFNPAYGFWADQDMWFQIAERYDVAFVPDTLIDLPSREVMPHLFGSDAWRTHCTIFRIYWDARCRHFRGRPAWLAASLLFQVASFVLTKTRRVFRRLLSRLKPAIGAAIWRERI